MDLMGYDVHVELLLILMHKSLIKYNIKIKICIISKTKVRKVILISFRINMEGQEIFIINKSKQEISHIGILLDLSGASKLQVPRI